MNVETPSIITQDSRMFEILRLAQQVADYGTTTLIIGESGTGKDLLAQYIYALSPRYSKPFIRVDCAAIPYELIESELFGHEKGAFTSAITQRIGKFELANNGTIYLDQIEDLPLSVQSKLARVIEERCFERVGGNEKVNIDIQIISSSRISLISRLKEGTFRKDLFFRLSIVPLNLPPLRHRRDDVQLLSMYFLKKYSQKYNRTVPNLHSDATDRLVNYYWPGNIRELETIIERMIISYSELLEITVSHLPIKIDDFTDESLYIMADQDYCLADLERLYIQKILIKTKGNKSSAASILGINRKTLLEKRRRYNLE
jgi:two-component system, NtrC family, response regulator AtoC